MKYNFVPLGVPAAEKSVNDVVVSVNVLGIGGGLLPFMHSFVGQIGRRILEVVRRSLVSVAIKSRNLGLQAFYLFTQRANDVFEIFVLSCFVRHHPTIAHSLIGSAVASKTLKC